jgi:hypothetical protein
VRGCNTKIVSCITPSPNLSPQGVRSLRMTLRRRRYAANADSLAGSPAMRLCHMMRFWVMSQGVA